MTITTTPAIFSYTVNSGSERKTFEHTHAVPKFLCEPDLYNQRPSQDFHTAFFDVLAVVNAQHHEECMRLIACPCAGGCQRPATDCLKAPLSLLHLKSDPMVMIHVLPVCGDRVCEAKTRRQYLEGQKKGIERENENEKKMFKGVKCAMCGKPDAKRCLGCGKVGYCGKDCQTEDWKAHKRDCRRKNVNKGVARGDLPYETI